MPNDIPPYLSLSPKERKLWKAEVDAATARGDVAPNILTNEQLRQELLELGMYRLLCFHEGDIHACINNVLEQSGPDDLILKFAGSDPAKWWSAYHRTERRIKAFHTNPGTKGFREILIRMFGNRGQN
jgi:hypothetical protein